MGKAGKLTRAGVQLPRPAPGDLVTFTVDELLSMTQDQLKVLAEQVVLPPGINITADCDKRQLVCRLIQAAIQIN